MAVLTAPATIGALLKYELDGNYTRETVTLKSGANYALGSVLGKITIGSATAATKSGGNTGNGAMTLDATTPVLAGAKVGVYAVRCVAAAVDGGTFRIEDPDGYVLGDVAVGATFADGVKFAIADGSTDFVVGDGFDITVAAGSGKYTLSPVAAVDGSGVAVAVLLDAVDATDADAEGVVVLARGPSIVSADALVYAASVDDAAKKATKRGQLVAVGIVSRATA